MMDEIMAGEATHAQIGGFLVALRMKGETPDEIAGFAEAIRAHGARRPAGARPTSSTPPAPAATASATINISTAAALVAAAAGAASPSTATARSPRRRARPTCSRRSASRSSSPPERIAGSIDELGFGFLFAPAHHPGFRHAAPVRASSRPVPSSTCSAR